jgi:20S proteasome subunit alpha 5
MKAVEDGWTTVGIQTSDGVILAAEKKIQNKLQVPSSIEKITKIDDNVICTYSGLLSDARALIEYARVEAANHWFTFNEKMPVESISLSVCDVALSFADKDSKKKEQKRKVARPFGVALLLAGIDRNGQARLFRNDPSGNYTRYKACSIGAGGENGMNTLQELFKDEMTLEQGILLAGKVIKENMEQKINKDNIEISYIRSDDKTIVKLTPDQLETLIPQF